MASLICDQSMMPNLVFAYRKPNVFDGSLNFDKPFTAKMAEFDLNKSNHLKNESIHSGHFMVSEIEENDENLSDKNEVETVQDNKVEVGKMLVGYSEVGKALYRSSHKVAIDGSLTKLFQCMTLAYDDARLTSPRWKTFKGLKLNIKDKIRLNNIIWRAWHIQYISGRKPEVCQFSSATTDTERHKKIEAILLEGKYWKRKHNVIKAEYKKWRLYYQHIYRTETLLQHSPYDWENNLPRWTNNLSFDSGLFSFSNNTISPQQMYNNMYSNGYGNYYEFTNPREIARSGMGAEFMQPGLEQLQPSIDFMDTFEPMQDIFRLPTVQEELNFESSDLKETPEEMLSTIFATSTEESANSISGLFDSSNAMSGNNKMDVGPTERGAIECFPQATKVSTPETFSYSSVSTPSITQTFTPISNSSLNQVNSMSTSLDNLYKIDYDMTTSALPLVNNLESNSKITRFQQENQSENNFSLPMFYEQDSSKSLKNKYLYSSYVTTNNAQSINDKFSDSSINESQKNSNHLRPSNSSVNNAKNMTIKNLLNTPSLTSTLASHNPFSSFSQTNTALTPNRNNIEKSISLPIYGKKSEMSDQAFLTKFSRENSSNQFSGVELKDSTYSMNNVASNNYFESGGRILSVTSPGSSNDSSFSNQESQCLPQMNKVLSASVDYGTGKLIDFSATSGNHQIYLANDSPKSRIGKIAPNTVNSASLSAYTPKGSSSSSSPIGSFDSNSNPNQTIINFTAGSSFGKGKSIFQLSPRNGNEPRKGLKKSFGSLDYGMKEKVTSEPMSTSFASASSLTNGPLSLSASKVLSFKHLSNPMHLSSNPSSFGSAFKSEDRVLYKERRRVCHINAEQKRRCNIKNGFDTLRNLLPSLGTSVNTKVSKAAMLHKAADYIRTLKSEKFEQQKEYDMLRQQVESLNQTISVFQSQLPATGAPIVGQRISQIKEQYAEYVKTRTMENWKFWVFSIIMESLLDSYCNTVDTTNFEEMFKTLNRWLEQNCCLITLRKDILKSLRYISTSTNILSNPEVLQQDILKAIAPKLEDEDDDL